jgi:hypothetical protein
MNIQCNHHVYQKTEYLKLGSKCLCMVWPKTVCNLTLDPYHPLPGLPGRVLIVRHRWKLERVSRTAGLCSELSSCHVRCAPVAEEEDYDVMYFMYGVHPTFKKRYESSLL